MNVVLSNCFDNLALMLDAGVPHTKSLRIVADAVTSRALTVRLEYVVDNIAAVGWRAMLMLLAVGIFLPIYGQMKHMGH